MKEKPRLSAEQGEELKAATLKNILEKIAAGGVPTKREQEILDANTKREEEAQGSAYARTWDELATALGIEERSLFNFRKRHAVRIKELGRSLTRADGRHVVAAWRALGDELGELKGKGINNPDIDYIDERQLRLRRERVALQREELKLAIERDQLLPVAEYQAALAEMVGGFNAALNQVPGRATRRIEQRARSGLMAMLKASLTRAQYEKVEAVVESSPIDYADIQEILQNEIDLTKRSLAEAQFIQEEAGRE